MGTRARGRGDALVFLKASRPLQLVMAAARFFASRPDRSRTHIPTERPAARGEGERGEAARRTRAHACRASAPRT